MIVYWLGGGGQQAVNQRGAGGHVWQFGEDGDKFVAAQPGDGVAFAQAALHPLGHGHQQHVARRVAVGVVDCLEAVQIDIRHGQQQAVAAGLRQGVAQPIGQQHAVGQAGERIVVGNEFQLLLVLLLRGDVGKQRHVMPGVAGAVAHGADGQQLGVFFAVLAPVPQFAGPIAVVNQCPPHLGIKHRALAVRLEQAGVAANHFVTRVAGNARKRFVDINNCPIWRGDDNAFAGMAEHRGGQARIRFAAVAQHGVADGPAQRRAFATLGQIVFCAQVDGALGGGHIVQPGEHHNRRIGQAATARHGLRAAGVGQVQIQQDHVRNQPLALNQQARTGQ